MFWSNSNQSSMTEREMKGGAWEESKWEKFVVSFPENE